jgi:hypothetical protein
MFKPDIREAKPIVHRALQNLLLGVSDRGRPGSDVRRAVGSVMVQTEVLLRDDTIGEPLANCFDLAREAGMLVPNVVVVYDGVAAESPVTLGGTLIKDALISLCCANGARIIADMTFKSREQVDTIRGQANRAFAGIEEAAADAMDSESYIAMVRLHAATVNYLIETARPLPRLLVFRFAVPLTTLIAGHRLYDDAARADELREENKVVHPAFMRPVGRALSA